MREATEACEMPAAYAEYWLTVRSPEGNVHGFHKEGGELPFQG